MLRSAKQQNKMQPTVKQAECLYWWGNEGKKVTFGSRRMILESERGGEVGNAEVTGCFCVPLFFCSVFDCKTGAQRTDLQCN